MTAAGAHRPGVSADVAEGVHIEAGCGGIVTVSAGMAVAAVFTAAPVAAVFPGAAAVFAAGIFPRGWYGGMGAGIGAAAPVSGAGAVMSGGRGGAGTVIVRIPPPKTNRLVFAEGTGAVAAVHERRAAGAICLHF